MQAHLMVFNYQGKGVVALHPFAASGLWAFPLPPGHAGAAKLPVGDRKDVFRIDTIRN